MLRKTLVYGFTTAIIAVVITVIIVFSVMQNYMYEETEQDAVSMARVVAKLTSDMEKSEYEEFAKKFSLENKTRISQFYRITIIDEDGSVLGDSISDIDIMDNHLDRPEITSAKVQDEKNSDDVISSTRFSDTLNINMIYVAIFQKDHYVRIAIPFDNISYMRKNLLSSSVISMIIGIIIAFVMSFIMAKNLSQPIEKLSKQTKSIRQKLNYDDFKFETKTEIDTLAKSIWEMANELKSSLREVKKTNTQFNAVLSNIQSGLVALDKDGKILYINPVAKVIFDIQDIDVVEDKNLEFLMCSKELIDVYKKCVENQKPYTLRKQYGSIDIRDYTIDVHPIIDDNRMQGVLILFTDITTRLKLEKMRSDFVANVSHELRTPLTSIKGYAEALNDDMVSSQAKRFLDIIEIEADRLNVLINDLMELSRIENRNEDTDISIYNMQKISDEVISLITIKAEKRNIQISSDVSSDIFIYANKNRIKQLLINLMDNGIKYNKDNGKLSLNITSKENMLTISVKDTGEGIAQEDMARLFERFYRVDKSRSRELGGTGLGLSIVKHIAELYNGCVQIKSEVRMGSEFIIRMPIVYRSSMKDF